LAGPARRWRTLLVRSRSSTRPIVIVKRRKSGDGGHHGGAWKVAYADFVTAMMALFLVMWLVTSVNKEQRALEGGGLNADKIARVSGCHQWCCSMRRIRATRSTGASALSS
jgi:Membrane MotB of proton-channel complex MotA/MotB